MAMKIEELLKSKRQEILTIAARHGAHNVRVFGSVAKGEAGAGVRQRSAPRGQIKSPKAGRMLRRRSD